MNLEAQADKILEMYTVENLTTVEIANVMGCSSSGVGRLLLRHGVKPFHAPNEIQIPKSEWPCIVREYKSGTTTLELGEKYHVCDRTIAKIIRLSGGALRPASRRSKIGCHDYFHKIDAPEKAYFLGWMMTDGSVISSKSRNNRSDVISIELQSGDRYIIEKFALALHAPLEIVRDNTSRGHSYMRFASAQMSSDLAQYNIVPNKQHLKNVPDLPHGLVRHFIRGVFDGDGTVTIPNNPKAAIRFAFYGSETICYQIRDILHREIGAPLNKVGKSTCYHIWYSSVTLAAKFYNYLYDGCGDLCLIRKRQKFDSVLF